MIIYEKGDCLQQSSVKRCIPHVVNNMVGKFESINNYFGCLERLRSYYFWFKARRFTD